MFHDRSIRTKHSHWPAIFAHDSQIDRDHRSLKIRQNLRGSKEARRCNNNRPALLRIPRTVLRWGHRWVPVTEPPRTRPTRPGIEGTRNTRPALDRGEAPRTWSSSRLCPTLPQDRPTPDNPVDERTTAPIRVGLAIRASNPPIYDSWTKPTHP